MEERVGTCSLCGGDVIGVRGGWWATTPPPPDTCRGCGAVARHDVITMTRPLFRQPTMTTAISGQPTNFEWSPQWRGVRVLSPSVGEPHGADHSGISSRITPTFAERRSQ